ncbi:MAG TPA: BTAD domain-containing putative transcriptional regulator [Acidimicrobiales bacterium]|nr:BTAD domain-containing putative transcriptional regulator [Acidimicrobiales bacterium]
MIEVRLLGPVVVESEGETVLLRRTLELALLARLALGPGRMAPTERLIDDLWANRGPRDPAASLQTLVYRLRRSLGPDGDLVIRDGNGYALMVRPDHVDVCRFDAMVARARDRSAPALGPADARVVLRRALELWRGPAFAGLERVPFVAANATRLEAARLAALEARVDADLEAGAHAEVITELEGLVSEHPFRERFWAQLMTALYRNGAQAAALRSCSKLRELLADQLGLAPSSMILSLEQAILCQDPAVDWHPPPERAASLVTDGEAIDPGLELRHLEGATPGDRRAPDAQSYSPGAEKRSARHPLERGPTTGQVVRKTVTVLFCDLVGWTTVAERHDPEAARRLVTAYFESMRRVLERHGATVEKFIGGAVMAIFGVPEVHEDDALRAVRAAKEMQSELAGLNDELQPGFDVVLRTRVGISTGEVVIEDGSQGTVATGEAVNLAALIEQAAPPGQILIGEATWRLVRDLVRAEPVAALPAKGESGPVAAWLLVEVPAGTDRPPTRALSASFVGRARELRAVQEAFERANTDRCCQLVTVLGMAGVGKSRLVAEFEAGLAEGVVVLHGRCLSYGESVAFWPVLEVLRAAAALDGSEPAQEVRERLAALVGPQPDADQVVACLAPLAGVGGSASSPEEARWAFRRLLEALSRRAPVVVLIDDLQWGQPALFELLEHVADFGRDAPILLLCVARPELLEVRPAWAGGKLDAVAMNVRPLHEREIGQLVDEVLGGPVDQQLRDQVVSAAGGLPLFAEQLLANLVETGRLTHQNDQWAAAGLSTALELPPTLQALLAARLDQLTPAERHVLQAAAVVGESFYLDAVRELAAEPGVEGLLAHLVRKQLIAPTGSEIAGQSAYRFLHILVRDATYAGTSKAARSNLHVRFAQWLGANAGDVVGDADEFVGYHLEQAVHLRTEIGEPVRDTVVLARTAAQSLRAAADRLIRVDPASAAALLERAANLLPAGDQGRVEMLLRRVPARMLTGAFALARDELDSVGPELGACKDERLITLAELRRTELAMRIDPNIEVAWLARQANRAIGRYPADAELLASAYAIKVEIGQMLTRMADVTAAAPLALRYADECGTGSAIAIFYLMDAVVEGPMPVGDAHGELDRLEAAMVDPGPWVWVALATARARLHALSGDAVRMRLKIDQARAVADELHSDLMYVAIESHGSNGELRLGDYRRALPVMQSLVDRLVRVRETGWLSLHAAELGQLHLLCGAIDEATRLRDLSRETTATEDLISQAYLHMLGAELELKAGRAEEAVRLAREAVRFVADSDMVVFNGLLHERLATVLLAARHRDEAGTILRSTVQAYESKEYTVGIRRLSDYRLAKRT